MLSPSTAAALPRASDGCAGWAAAAPERTPPVIGATTAAAIAARDPATAGSPPRPPRRNPRFRVVVLDARVAGGGGAAVDVVALAAVGPPAYGTIPASRIMSSLSVGPAEATSSSMTCAAGDVAGRNGALSSDCSRAFRRGAIRSSATVRHGRMQSAAGCRCAAQRNRPFAPRRERWSAQASRCGARPRLASRGRPSRRNAQRSCAHTEPPMSHATQAQWAG